MLKAGEFAFDRNTGKSVQVLERLEVWGYVSYRVFDPSTGRVYKVMEDSLSDSSGSNTYDENYLRYVSLLSKIKNETAGGLLTSLASGVIPLPHQLHVLNRVMSTNNIRYILADEVGLGKTIEAGMVIKELKARGLVRRTLVVCPTGLVTQWSAEMQEKFHEKFQVILPSDYDTIHRLTDSDDVYGQYDQVISPMDSIKPLEKHAGWTEERVEQYNQERIYSIINSGWDLIIIDEAHRVAGSSGEVARYKLGYLLSQASPYLLLLTATPHNGKTEPFLRLVRLLDEDAFPNAKSVVKEQVVPFLIRTEKREAIDNNGNLLFKNRLTHLVELTWDERHTYQRQLYEMVTSYVSKTYNKALRNRKKNMCLIFLLIIMQRMVTSSTAAIRQSLERRLEILKTQNTKLGSLTEEDLAELDIEDGVKDALHAMSLDVEKEISELENIIAVAKQAEFQHPDVKVETLENTIDTLLNADRNQKIIIFTEFVATQEYLQRLLTAMGYSVTILNGRMSIEERNEALREFRDNTNVFISTDENRVREVLEEKLSVILKEMGVDKYSDVLDSEVAEVDFTDVYMRSISRPHRKSDENLYPVESELRQELKNAQKYKSLLHEDKDLTKLVGKESNFDVDSALRQMLTYYDAWQGLDPRLIMDISINDESITRHLNADVIQDRFSPILSVSIQDFPNEEGYFMLWDLSVTDEEMAQRILPVFVNKDFVLRPMAGQRIMDVFLDGTSRLSIRSVPNLTGDEYQQLEKLSTEFAYDLFLELKDQQLKRNKESYDKYMYALKLRTEATEHVGIDNIRKSRLQRLEKEKAAVEERYRKGQEVYPEFRICLLVRLEA